MPYFYLLPPDVTIIRDWLINMFAARDTVCSPSSAAAENALIIVCRHRCFYTVYMFTQNPETLPCVGEELIETLGPDSTPALEDIRKLKYCALLVSENQRERNNY